VRVPYEIDRLGFLLADQLIVWVSIRCDTYLTRAIALRRIRCRDPPYCNDGLTMHGYHKG
jgi:hypothetical protein